MKRSDFRTTRAAKDSSRRRTVVSDSLEEIRRVVPNLGRIRVSDVIIGAGYTGVRLPSRHVGLAHSLLSEQAPGCCQLTERAGHLAGSSALELSRLGLSWDIRSRVVGIATLNALSQLSLSSHGRGVSTRTGDIADHLRVSGETVAVVGNMGPIVRRLRSRAKRLYVFERSLDLRDGGTLPDTAVEEILPTADVVLITGTSIVNGTVDRLLELSRDAKAVALVGPTAGLPPTTLFGHGATAVGTIRVTDGERVMRVIAEGGGTPSFAEAVEFVVHEPSRREGKR